MGKNSERQSEDHKPEETQTWSPEDRAKAARRFMDWVNKVEFWDLIQKLGIRLTDRDLN